jgi:hypothetical protein
MSSFARNVEIGTSDLNNSAQPAAPEAMKGFNHPRTDEALRLLTLFCAVAVLWLATRPYFGVVFDARFYMAEALRALDPARFGQDLYFQFGSQGNFSLFTKLYLPLLRAFGAGETALVLTVAGQLLWLFGLFRLARMLVGGRILWLSIVLVIGMASAYPGNFSYGENYLTARLYAEAVTMLGLAWLPSRPLPAVLSLGVAAAIHPLMALPGIALAFVYLALGRPLWWAVMGAGAALAVALALAGVAPFSNALQTIDPTWLAVIKLRSPHCLLTEWPAENYRQLAGVVAWAVAALVLAPTCHRRFLAAALVVGVGGLVCAFLGGDIAHKALVIQVQPWRSIWLLQLVLRITITLIFAAALARTSLDGFRWTVLLAMGLIVTVSATRLIRQPGVTDFTFASLVLVCAGLMVMAAQLLLTEQKHRRILLVSAIAGVMLVPAALWRWDMRSPWLRYVESPEPPPKELVALLPDGTAVYWEHGLEMLWFRMKRGSYFSCDQGTGALFYRQTAMAYRKRGASFWPLRTGDFGPLETCASLDPRPKPQRNRAGLQNLCIREPGLEYAVFAAPLAGIAPRGTWKSPVYFQDIQSTADKFQAPAANRFYIYACAGLR